MADIGIGRLAELTGVKIPTIRFYEQNNLVPPPCRTEGGQRRYDENAVRRLHFIRHARDLGFSVEDIRQLLALSDARFLLRKAGAALVRSTSMVRCTTRRMATSQLSPKTPLMLPLARKSR